ncbi:hypothetical protein NRY95_00325 [Xanthomonas campestris pv. phormiicola]|nr:hypothetical protein [Xanthomonas campestris pv. phormiicola]UYC16470.1 hypothetical protein NRY95_00325 [Xanthomonas campestris pv. phormiicola]
MRIYPDDERPIPPDWTWVSWPDEAIALLQPDVVAAISLDHDPGDGQRERGTGYDIVARIEDAVVTRGFVPPALRVHSANPAARKRMEAGIAAIQRHVARRTGA